MKLNDTTVNYLAQFCFGAAAVAFPPAAVGVTAAVGATALVALFHAERKKKKAAAQLDSEKALKEVIDRIVKDWRKKRPAEQKHEFLKQLAIAEEALQKALPHCTMDYTTLAQTSTEGAGKFPDKATELVLSQLDSIDPENFGGGDQNIAKTFARDVIQSAFRGAIENEAYFRKFEPQVLLAIAEKVGDIYDKQNAMYDMQHALKELSEHSYELLIAVDERTRRMEATLNRLTSIVGSIALRRAEEIGLNEHQIVTIADSFLEQGIPIELWGEKLIEGATRLMQLENDLAHLKNDEPEITSLIELAREAIDRGDIDDADGHLGDAVARDEAAGERCLRRAAENEGRRGDLAYSEGRYLKAADHFARAAKNIRPFDALDWARLKYNEGNAAVQRGILHPDRTHLQRAISVFGDALEEYTRGCVPMEWAMTQNSLGNALATLGQRGDDQALEAAINAYRDALEERTRERTPMDWATTQNNLGNALATLGERGHDQALKAAITAYRDALEERTRERAPLDWAMTQNNLGTALRTLGEHGDEQALKDAITTYRDALEERTRERVPLDWAMTQNNLGNALRTLGERGDEQALKDAISAFRDALKERTRDRVPLHWATTQNNLGNALLTLGKHGDEQALSEAITAYHEALKERTRKRVPLDWAMTQNNLGEAFEALGDGNDALDELVKARDCYRTALEEFKPDRAPAYEAESRRNLARVEAKLKAAGWAPPEGWGDG